MLNNNLLEFKITCEPEYILGSLGVSPITFENGTVDPSPVFCFDTATSSGICCVEVK